MSTTADMQSKKELLKTFAPVIIVTGAYFALYFAFMMFQSFSKFYLLYKSSKDKKNKKGDEKGPSLREIKYGDNKKGLALTSDRTFLNMLEQSPCFLVSFWMHAVFVSVENAAWAGWVYVVFRSLYPFVFALGPPWIFVSTLPGYSVIWYLCGVTVYECIRA